MEIGSIGDIAAFIAAARAGSFTEAGRRLGLTRSAVGKSIVRLEKRFGARLLNRTTRSLSLTDDGRLLFDRCCQILDDLEEVSANMVERRDTPVGLLRVTAPLSLGQRHVLPVVEEYLRSWPQLRADISFTDRVVDLIDEGFDVAIRIGSTEVDTRFIARTIGTQTYAVCASPDYLSRRGKPTTLSDLETHDTIMLVGSFGKRSWRFRTTAGPFNYDGPGRLNIDSTEAMRASCLAGYGLICLPTYILHQDMISGALVEVLQDFRNEPDPIRIIYPSKRQLSPRVRGFIDRLVDSWSPTLPWSI